MCQKQNANADKLFPVNLENLTCCTCCKNILIFAKKKKGVNVLWFLFYAEKTSRKFLLLY